MQNGQSDEPTKQMSAKHILGCEKGRSGKLKTITQVAPKEPSIRVIESGHWLRRYRPWPTRHRARRWTPVSALGELACRQRHLAVCAVDQHWTLLRTRLFAGSRWGRERVRGTRDSAAVCPPDAAAWAAVRRRSSGKCRAGVASRSRGRRCIQTSRSRRQASRQADRGRSIRSWAVVAAWPTPSQKVMRWGRQVKRSRYSCGLTDRCLWKVRRRFSG